MKQLPIEFSVARIGGCSVCDRSGLLNARICRSCEARYGRRTAELFARARQDRRFAEACLQRLGERERLEFLEILRLPPDAPDGLRGHGVRPGLRKCGGRSAVRVVVASGR